MAYRAIAVANDFISLACGKSLSPMKLQKLVYNAHGWYLALRDVPLIEESVEAWQFGPVIPELYREFKHYGESDITRRAKVTDYRTLKTYEPSVSSEETAESRHAFGIIKSVWTAYRDFSATRLSNATHKPGTPWSDTYQAGLRSIVIPNSLIKAYFKAL